MNCKSKVKKNIKKRLTIGVSDVIILMYASLSEAVLLKKSSDKQQVDLKSLNRFAKKFAKLCQWCNRAVRVVL